MTIETGDLAQEMERIARAYLQSVEKTGRGDIESELPLQPSDYTAAEWQEITEAQQ